MRTESDGTLIFSDSDSEIECTSPGSRVNVCGYYHDSQPTCSVSRYKSASRLTSTPPDVLEIDSDTDSDTGNIEPPPSSAPTGASSDDEFSYNSSPRSLLKDTKGKGRPKCASRDYSPFDLESDVESDNFPEIADIFQKSNQAKRKRAEDLDDSDSEVSIVSTQTSPKKVKAAHRTTKVGDDAQVSCTKKRRPRKTSEEKELEAVAKAEAKAKRQAESDAKKAKKQQEADAKKAKRLQEKLDKETAKEQVRIVKSANKLQIDKKKTLENVTLVLSAAFLAQEHSPFVGALRKKMDAHGCRIITQQPKIPGMCTMQWIRRVTAEYDVDRREWVPCEAYDRPERTALLWLSADQLLDFEAKGRLKDAFIAFRGVYQLKDHDQAQFMVYGKPRVHDRPKIDAAILALQFSLRTFDFHATTIDEAVTRVFNISGDLGIKPHKFIERSHLPFCPRIEGPCGKGSTDTWIKVLDQVNHMTEEEARAIARKMPTLRTLFRAYEERDANEARDMLSECQVEYTKAGAQRQRTKLGAARSARVYDVFWGQDPLQLVVNRHDSAANQRSAQGD
ncbi:hypothetical protein FISHEDRAFT_78257 [Fistulina hepatica ATCC 64428]|nr:hypothetical protein FISHEDRAFT_78257 [Fistulina hepatica ATCC 64428]